MNQEAHFIAVAPKEEKDNLFEPFVGSSIRHDVPGSIRIGLTILKKISNYSPVVI